ncbi:MAG: cupin domain-containing protein [Alphaproteobacteria bacterium]
MVDRKLSPDVPPKVTPIEQAEHIHPFGGLARVLMRTEDTGGVLSALLVTHGPGEGPPPHSHADQTEYFFVVDGRYEMTIDGVTTIMEPGSMGFAPPNAVHTFRNIADHDGHMFDFSLPGGQDRYFRDISDMGKGGKGFTPEMMERLAVTNREHGVTFHKK